MEQQHQPGCDGAHTARQPCNVPPVDDPAPAPRDGAPAARDYRLRYCLRCGRANDGDAVACRRCLTPFDVTGSERVRGLAFLLNEAQYGALGGALGDRDRELIVAGYEAELLSLLAPRPIATVPERPQPTMPITTAPAAGAGAPRPAGGGRRGGGAPAAPRKPRDWSWLAEQQANLFLFTGAFLVVVAALIYVAYSGQAVSGALKMSLLVGFMLAFLAAGLVCLRIPRVAAAGQVFFGIGAILVPLTFVAAYTVLSDRDLDPEALWLAGSLTSALFYTLVATTGLGRPYAYASGIAWISAAAGGAAVAGLSAEWWPAVFVALAILMSTAALFAPAALRDRVAEAWIGEARATVALAVGAAIVIALAAAPDASEVDLASRWFLPATFAAALAYAAITVAGTRDDEAGVAALIAFSGALVTVVYALARPAAEYAIAFAALAVILGAAIPAIESDAIGRALPGAFSRAARTTAIAATIAAAAVAFFIAGLSRQPDAADVLVPQTRWFAAPASALVLVFYLLDALSRRRREAIAGSALSLAALGASCVYGLGASPEYYALALTGAGAAIVLVLRGVMPRLPRRLLHPAAGGDLRALVHVALIAGVAVALAALRAQYAEASTYAAQTRWFLLATFASACAAYAAFLALPPGGARFVDDARHSGFALSFAGTCTAVVYGLHASPEYYSFAFVGAAIAVFGAGVLVWPRIGIATDTAWARGNYLTVAHAAALLAIVVGSAAAIASATPDSSYQPDSRSFLPALFATLAAFHAICVLSRASARGWEAVAPLGFAASVIGVCAGIVYALQASAEYYAFAFLVPAIPLAAAARTGSPATIAARLPDGWREGAVGVARAAVIAGIAVAVVAAIVAAPAGSPYAPDSRAYLPLAFVAAAAALAFDASRERRWQVSTALLAALGGAGVTIPYALDAGAAYYGAAFAGVGLLYGLGGRAWSPAWLHDGARDAVGAVAVTAAWLPVEGIYTEAQRVGAGVHFAAAAYYAFAALADRRGRTLGELFDAGSAGAVPIASGWLYAAGLAGSIGYVHLWRALAAGEGAEALAFPLLGLTLAFLAATASARYWRREFGVHLYIMAVLASVACLASARDAGVLAVLLSSLIAAFVAVALWEDTPALAVPAAAFGFIAVAAWQRQLDAPEYTIPLAFAAIALVVYAAGYALRDSARRWSDAARACGSAYALAGPGAGFAILAVRTHGGELHGAPFERSALYQWSTAAVAVTGVLAVVESSIARRGWVVVLGSGVLAVALLLEIGHFRPGSAQPYAITLGAYLLLLGILGLSKFHLISAREDVAQAVDAAGALIVMAPSAIQAWSGGWPYLALLLGEAALFFALSVTLRRRLLLAVSLAALLGVVARALFDAVNALPNWIVVLLAGMVLLSIGTAILIGRERWARWQDGVLSWWQHGAPRQPAP